MCGKLFFWEKLANTFNVGKIRGGHGSDRIGSDRIRIGWGVFGLGRGSDRVPTDPIRNKIGLRANDIFTSIYG